MYNTPQVPPGKIISPLLTCQFRGKLGIERNDWLVLLALPRMETKFLGTSSDVHGDGARVHTNETWNLQVSKNRFAQIDGQMFV